eukprot:531371-Alexandrium_andersonii.AAC.1
MRSPLAPGSCRGRRGDGPAGRAQAKQRWGVDSGDAMQRAALKNNFERSPQVSMDTHIRHQNTTPRTVRTLRQTSNMTCPAIAVLRRRGCPADDSPKGCCFCSLGCRLQHHGAPSPNSP